jgi:glucose/mannose transport system substrate-binding protein
MKLLPLAALWAAVSVAGVAQAQNAEVIHWWTSQGEAAAAKVLADAYRKAGGTWVDTAIANPIQGRNVTVNRMVGGKPPTVAQFNPSLQYRELIDQGLMNSIDEVAGPQKWDQFLTDQTKKAVKSDGKYYAVPVGIHNSGWFWYSKAVFAKAGIKAEPQNIDEFFLALDKIKKTGTTPLALGGQSWQENILFITLLHTSGGADLYLRFFGSTDGKVAETAEFKKVLSDFKRLKYYVDVGSPNREWNLATSMVISESPVMLTVVRNMSRMRSTPAISAMPSSGRPTEVSTMPIMIEVAISEFIIRYEPSPTITVTCRDGSAIFTPRPPAIS